MQWGCLLVLLFALIHELFSRERRIAAVAFAAAINGALLYAVDAWFVPLDMTIRWKDFTALSGLPLAVIGFFPLAAIILAVWEPASARTGGHGSGDRRNRADVFACVLSRPRQPCGCAENR